MTPLGISRVSIRLVLANGNLFIGERVAQSATQRQQPVAKRLRPTIHGDMSFPENIPPSLIVLRFASQAERVGSLSRGEFGHRCLYLDAGSVGEDFGLGDADVGRGSVEQADVGALFVAVDGHDEYGVAGWQREGWAEDDQLGADLTEVVGLFADDQFQIDFGRVRRDGRERHGWLVKPGGQNESGEIVAWL